MESIVNFIFGFGLFINAALFIPQILLLLKKQHADDVSLTTFLGFFIIQLFTILHGLYTHDWILVAGYIASIATCGTTTMLIIYYRFKNKK